MNPFTVFPAIDLRGGEVVRLAQGDPNRKTTYSNQAASAAARWLEAGADWLHIVNLDGAFGEADQPNQQALADIVKFSKKNYPGCRIQLGGGRTPVRSVTLTGGETWTRLSLSVPL